MTTAVSSCFRLSARVAWLAAGLLLLGAARPGPMLADGSWLDQPLANWNSPGMELWAAPASGGPTNPNCADQGRPAETDADAAVAEAGWTVYGSYTGGWGVLVVRGLSGLDGMCRPLGYQEFVFVDGVLAGTLSPMPMDSRTDGAGDLAALQNADELTATFQRYAPTDPACCPSSQRSVTYTIDRSGPAPVLVPR
jgi:LppP/LprE lipoprotein